MLDFIFPPTCMTCDVMLPKGGPQLCDGCGEMIELADVAMRCKWCFTKRNLLRKDGCGRCLEGRRAPVRVAATLTGEGPAGQLVRAFSKGKQWKLARPLASYMAFQFNKLGWDKPEFIVPIPRRPLERMWVGYNPSVLLAQELSRLLNCPTIDVLKAKRGWYKVKRLQGRRLRCKRVLLVDDLIKTGATFGLVARTLRAYSYADPIYALALAKVDPEVGPGVNQ